MDRQAGWSFAEVQRGGDDGDSGKLRPLGISTVRDRVCMTAAMLVLEPIFEADLPPEIYAYRAGRNAQQAAVEVEELLFRGHPEVVDGDLADYLEGFAFCAAVRGLRAGFCRCSSVLRLIISLTPEQNPLALQSNTQNC